jgi:hypothetical protein
MESPRVCERDQECRGQSGRPPAGHASLYRSRCHAGPRRLRPTKLPQSPCRRPRLNMLLDYFMAPAAARGNIRASAPDGSHDAEFLRNLLKRCSLRKPAQSVDHSLLVGHAARVQLHGSEGKSRVPCKVYRRGKKMRITLITTAPRIDTMMINPINATHHCHELRSASRGSRRPSSREAPIADSSVRMRSR